MPLEPVRCFSCSIVPKPWPKFCSNIVSDRKHIHTSARTVSSSFHSKRCRQSSFGWVRISYLNAYVYFVISAAHECACQRRHHPTLHESLKYAIFWSPCDIIHISCARMVLSSCLDLSLFFSWAMLCRWSTPGIHEGTWSGRGTSATAQRSHG